jgi:hypothetical protein
MFRELFGRGQNSCVNLQTHTNVYLHEGKLIQNLLNKGIQFSCRAEISVNEDYDQLTQYLYLFKSHEEYIICSQYFTSHTHPFKYMFYLRHTFTLIVDSSSSVNLLFKTKKLLLHMN